VRNSISSLPLLATWGAFPCSSIFHLAPPFLLCVNVILGVFIDERRRAGELMTDAGVMNLHRNTTLFMRRDEVEPLIRQGVLEHMQTSVQ